MCLCGLCVSLQNGLVLHHVATGFGNSVWKTDLSSNMLMMCIDARLVLVGCELVYGLVLQMF